MAPEIVPNGEALDQVACDVLVVGATASNGSVALSDAGTQIDAALENHLSGHLDAIGAKGRIGEVTLVPTMGRLPAKAVAVVGLGDKGTTTSTEVRRAAGVAARRLGEHPVIASALHDGDTAAAVEGFMLGSYRFTQYKSDPRPSKIQRVLLLGTHQTEDIDKGRARAEATELARDLVNEPPGVLTPAAFGERANEVADIGGLECVIFAEEQLKEKGFGGILGVSQGSVEPPRFIQLKYAPQGATTKLALVGKGITFDSGGLSIKDAKNMETMKTDMGGAAAVIGAMSALPKLGLNVEVTGYIAASENMPSGSAIKPGDVIRHYGGRTSEVLNTDAEGRLVLADALAWACEQKPAAVVNAATLTGAMMIALGRKAAGVFANNDELRAELEAAGAAAGERLWPMPIYSDYRADIDSEIADVKNVGTRYGGAIYAALFLADFVDPQIPWAHIDIAGPARAESDYDEITRGGTGFGARTMLAWVEGRAS